MAPAWEKLAKEWDGNDQAGLIAYVDCTSEKGKSLCDDNGVRGFPTLKYGDPSSLDSYQGKRGYDDLSKFAKANLKPLCSPANLDLCDDGEREQIESFLKLSKDEINDKIKSEQEKLKQAEDEFNKAVEQLQEEYAKLSEEKDKTILDVREGGLGHLKAVKAFKEKHGDDGTATAKKDEL